MLRDVNFEGLEAPFPEPGGVNRSDVNHIEWPGAKAGALRLASWQNC